MATFPVTDPLDISLRFINPYTAPEAGTNVVLRFGQIGDAEILSESSEILLTDTGQQVSVVVAILAEPSEILLTSTESEVEIVIELNSEPSDIRIGIPEQLVEHLPEVLSSVSEILIQSEDEDIGGGQENDLPNKLGNSGLSMSWFKAQNHVGKNFQAPWDDPIDVRIKSDIPWEEKEQHVQKELDSPYINIMEINDNENSLPWGDFINLLETDKKVPYRPKMDYFDTHSEANWSGFVPRGKKVINRFKVTKGIEGDFKDSHNRIKWAGEFLQYDKLIENGFNNNLNSQFKTKHNGTYWGPKWYSLWCETKYFPYKAGEFITLNMGKELESFDSSLKFLHPNNIKCPYDYWYSGPRENNYSVIIPSETKYIPLKEVYYMLNSMFVQRLPDNAPINIKNISLSIDRDSWLWDFQMTVLEKSHLDLIKPQNGTFINVLININGWVWTCKIESWQETVRFGKRAWVVNGRSPSAVLSAPYDLKRAISNSTDVNAEGLITDLLFGTGFSVDWQSTEYYNPAIDWSIPEGIFNVSDHTTIKAIQHVLEACGAFIQTSPDTDTDPTLYVKPKYIVEPWQWSARTPEIELNDAICSEIGRRYTAYPEINSVIVSGETDGVVCSAVKDGTAGDKGTSAFIHPLITTLGVGKERSRILLGESGNWVEHTLKLFALDTPSTNDCAGLVLPGTFMSMNESVDDDWKGQVTGTQIEAGWGQDGLVIHQILDVEQYYE